MGGRGTSSRSWHTRSSRQFVRVVLGQAGSTTGAGFSNSNQPEHNVDVLPTGILVPQLESPALATIQPIAIQDTAQTASVSAPSNSGASTASTSPEGSSPLDAPISGTAIGSSQPDSPLEYTIIDQETAMGGAIYPFLENTGRAWRIIESNVKDPAEYPNPHTFGMADPTLRYVNGSKVEDTFVDGLTTQELLARTGLELSMNKGGFVLSKRLSRIMRPYFASGYFSEDDATVKYMDNLRDDEGKWWDVVGLI